MRERNHRFQPDTYRGKRAVAFTACMKNREPILNDKEVFDTFVPMLGRAAELQDCIVPIYLFMPDHVHMLIIGRQDQSDPRVAMRQFKAASGGWLYRHRPGIRWQKDFWDHVVREYEGWRSQARYIAANPYRAGLCVDDVAWPFMGAIGVDLSEVIQDACW